MCSHLLNSKEFLLCDSFLGICSRTSSFKQGTCFFLLTLTLIRVASQPTLKEWLVGILIPTDVGLLIPTTQCHTFGTVKNGKNA